MLGLFDSGLGGLTVLKEITKILPKYSFYLSRRQSKSSLRS